MSDLLSKLFDYALKAIPTLLMSGTGYQLFDGRWFGQTIFGAYLATLQVQMLTPPSSAQLYSALGSQSLTDSARNISGGSVLLVIAGVLVLVAHVLYKSTAKAARASRVPPPPRRAILQTVRARYVRHYHLVTLAIFAVLLSLFIAAKFTAALVVLLVLIAAPATLYLALYSKDATGGTYVERFVWVFLLVCLMVTLAAWPYQYGRRVYTPSFATASFSGDIPDHCDGQRLQKGPTFAVTDLPGDEQFFRLCFGAGQDIYIDFFSYAGAAVFSGRDPLARVVGEFEAPPATPGSLAAVEEQLQRP
jgi:hypothetical protein